MKTPISLTAQSTPLKNSNITNIMTVRLIAALFVWTVEVLARCTEYCKTVK